MSDSSKSTYPRWHIFKSSKHRFTALVSSFVTCKVNNYSDNLLSYVIQGTVSIMFKVVALKAYQKIQNMPKKSFIVYLNWMYTCYF